MNPITYTNSFAQTMSLRSNIISISTRQRGGSYISGIEKLMRNTATGSANDKIMRINELFNVNIISEFGVAAALEARRLSEKYGKDYLNCDDLVSIMGIGKNNARQLLNSSNFPTIEVGNRKVVSIIAFALWSLQSSDNYALA